MKIPFLPLHVVTSKTLEEKLNDAREEVKGFRQTQINKLLSRNAAAPVRIRGGKKKGV